MQNFFFDTGSKPVRVFRGGNKMVNWKKLKCKIFGHKFVISRNVNNPYDLNDATYKYRKCMRCGKLQMKEEATLDGWDTCK